VRGLAAGDTPEGSPVATKVVFDGQGHSAGHEGGEAELVVGSMSSSDGRSGGASTPEVMRVAVHVEGGVRVAFSLGFQLREKRGDTLRPCVHLV